MLVPLLALPARAEDPLDPYLGNPGHTYPNLVPDVEVVTVDITRDNDAGFEFGTFLKYDTRAQNLGTVPVQVTIDEVETPETSTVSQCVSWRSAPGHVCREMVRVGGYTWHDQHSHFHYEDFATYELRALTPEGRADYSEAGLLRKSGKVSFCFFDLDWVGDLPSTAPFYTEGSCSAPVVMGISPQWTDVYNEELPGQNMDIAGLPNGEYALITNINYERTLRETNYDDDTIEVRIRIFDDPDALGGKNAEILGKRWPAPHERVPSSTPTTTTSVVTTTTTLPGPPPTPENGRHLGPAPLLEPLFRRRTSTAGASPCSQGYETCTQEWARPGSPP